MILWTSATASHPRKFAIGFRAEGEAVLLQWKTEVRTGNTSQPGGRGE